MLHNQNDLAHECMFKVIIIGSTAVGKSCLLHRLTEDEFKDDHDVTVGVEFGSMCAFIENKTIKL